MFPESTANMTLSDLQALAARQQVAMETQQQALVARETRLTYLQQQGARQQQLCSEEGRLQLMRERVGEQELKLKRLRALRGQVEHYRTHNGQLNSELEAVRALFSQKEKELALAVSRVDTLMKQLQDLREVKAREVAAHGNAGQRGNSKALTLELERLRKELMERNQINAQYTSRLAAQRQLLQHRKDQAAKVDDRIEELQQRLKKRRCQQSATPPQHAPLEKGGERGGWGPQGGRKVGHKVAAVEPYCQRPPKDAAKDADGRDLPSTGAPRKQDPKSPTTSSGQVSSGEKDSAQRGVPQPGGEVNNNDKGGGKGGEKGPEEHKIPSVVSSHFDAQRARQGSGGTGAGGKDKAAEAPPPPGQQPHGQGPAVSSPRISTSGGTPTSPPSALNSFGKPDCLSMWPPAAVVGEGGGEPPPPAHHPHQPPHHPHINIFDEERQAGSGQSSPASSEGSGPLVKQGSGVFTHHSPASPQSVTSAAAAAAQSTQQDRQKHGAQSASPLDPRAQHPGGRQAPKPPPRMPQTVLHSRVSAIPFSSGSAPSSSSSTAASSSADSASSTASSTSSQQQPVSTPPSDSAGQGVSGSVPGKQDSVHGHSDPASRQGQGEEGKVGAPPIHLNQRPAPTYRYAPKNVIANTYTNRLGSGVLQRYQQLTKQLYSTDGTSGSNGTDLAATGGNTQSHGSGTRSHSHTSESDSQPSASDRSVTVVVGEGGEGLTHFGLVGSPNYPDIASDKGSYKSNTPKQIRRRHSDSDNEELAKVLKRGGRLELERLTEDGANGGNIDPRPDPPTPPLPSPGGVEGGATQPQCGEGAQKAGTVSVRQRKTILKGDKRNTSHRVSFDPLALLLDASLEGELDLVMRSAREVEDVSRPNDEGITALHNAICAGHYHIVKFLIEFGADVNSPDSDGWTPLHCAASCNNLPMVRFLVEHGACLFATTLSDHETAADKCEEDEDGFDHCSDYLYGVQEKLGIANDGAVYAVFDYTATKQDELSFHINDKLTVLRKGDEEEKEWWWAVGRGNREGYIARNLLGLCPRVLPPATSHQPLQTSATSHQPLQTSDC